MEITNSLKFTCHAKRLNEILSTIKCDKTKSKPQYGIGTIDFNKIIPVPAGTSSYDIWETAGNAYDATIESEYGINFKTSNGVPLAIVYALAEKYPDVQIQYEWFGDYDFPCCGSVQYENGGAYAEHTYSYCNITIDVPEGFGYSENQYSLSVPPEIFGVDRNDFNGVAAIMLRLAIDDAAANNVGLMPSLTDTQYEQALRIAVDCVTRCLQIKLRVKKSWLRILNVEKRKRFFL